MNICTAGTTTDYEIVDGASNKQKNGFDCGVFSFANLEKHLTFGQNDSTLEVTQELMKLYRCRQLYKLYIQGLLVGLL